MLSHKTIYIEKEIYIYIYAITACQHLHHPSGKFWASGSHVNHGHARLPDWHSPDGNARFEPNHHPCLVKPLLGNPPGSMFMAFCGGRSHGLRASTRAPRGSRNLAAGHTAPLLLPPAWVHKPCGRPHGCVRVCEREHRPLGVENKPISNK